MNITNFIIYIQIYIPILYVTKMTQKKKKRRFSKLVLLAIIIVYYFLLQDFHI